MQHAGQAPNGAANPALKFSIFATLHQHPGKDLALEGLSLRHEPDPPQLIRGKADTAISSAGSRLCARMGMALKQPVGHSGPFALGFFYLFAFWEAASTQAEWPLEPLRFLQA